MVLRGPLTHPGISESGLGTGRKPEPLARPLHSPDIGGANLVMAVANLPMSAGSRRAVGVFCSWLLIGSTISGTVTTLQAGYALRAFGSADYIPRILALAIQRVIAPHIAALSVCFALVAWAHWSGPRGALGAWWIRLGLSFVIVPMATFPAAALTLFASFGAAAGMFGLTRATFTAGLLQAASTSDVVHGLTKAGVYGVVLGAAAAAGASTVARKSLRLRWKLALAWLVMALVLALVDFGMDPGATEDDAPDSANHAGLVGRYVCSLKPTTSQWTRTQVRKRGGMAVRVYNRGVSTASC